MEAVSPISSINSYMLESFPVISDNPLDYLSHFTQLTKRDKKGSARFQCRTCSHTFVTCGKQRLLQHILGNDYCLAKTKNVASCGKPFAPLKANLLQTFHARDAREKKEAQFITPLKQEEINFQEEKINTNCDINNDITKDIFQIFMEFKFLENIPFSECKSESSDSASPIISAHSYDPFRFRGDQLNYSPSEIGIALFNDEDARIVDLNRAIVKFFRCYGIPLTAVDSSSFHELIDAIHHSGSF